MEKNFDLVLIDADILLYQCAAVGERITYEVLLRGEVVRVCQSAREADNEMEIFERGAERRKVVEDRGIEYCKKAFEAQLKGILHSCNAKKYYLYLGEDSHNNFRVTNVATLKVYKGGRASEKPKYFNELKEWIKKSYDVIMSSYIESDDRLCIDSREDFNRAYERRNRDACRVVVATRDKDALTVPGWLYNPSKMLEPQWISIKQARHYFWAMALTGDTVDAIQGCPRIGKKKAAVILEGCKTDLDYWEAVTKQYHISYEDKIDEEGYFQYKHCYTGESMKKTPTEIAVEMCTLLHMLRYEDEVWHPPTGEIQ